MKLLKITTSVDYSESFRSGFGIILNLTYSNDQLRGVGHLTTILGLGKSNRFGVSKMGQY